MRAPRAAGPIRPISAIAEFDRLYHEMKYLPNDAQRADAHSAHAGDPGAGAPLDRALPPGGLRAEPCLAGQFQAHGHLLSGLQVQGRQARDARAAAGRMECAGALAAVSRADRSSSPSRCRRSGPTTGSACDGSLSPAPHRLRLPHRARRAVPAVRAVLRGDEPRRHRAQGGGRARAAGGLRAVEDQPRLRQAAVRQPRPSRAPTCAATPTRCSSSTIAACSPSISAAATPTTRASPAACGTAPGRASA